MKRVASLLLLILTSTAHADGDRGYIALGSSALFSAFDASIGTHTAEGGLRISKPLVARAVAGFGGGHNENANTGTKLWQLRAGIEADTCTAERGACAYAGVDVGWQFETTTYEDEDDVKRDTSRSVLMYRLGGDAGGDFIRVRFELEVTHHAVGAQLALVHRFY